MNIKTFQQLAGVLTLMRRAQKEAKRFPSKDRIAAAKYWESVVDGFLQGVGKKA
ncbi:MAG: hypothetical protein LBO80_04895 [Treponema sp.]|jgi:hypothetical protein|nr:hypothetical protein [Treponema sp.]